MKNYEFKESSAIYSIKIKESRVIVVYNVILTKNTSLIVKIVTNLTKKCQKLYKTKNLLVN